MEKKEIKRYLFIAGLAVVGFILVQNFSVIIKFIGLVLGAVQPLILGAVMAYIFNIVMTSFEKWYFPSKKDGFLNNTRRPVCLVMSFAITALLIAMLLKIIIPEVVSAFKLMGNYIPEFVDKSRKFINEKLDEYPWIQKELGSFEFNKSSFTEKFTYGAFSVFNSAIAIIGTVTSTVTNIIIGIIFAIYLLARNDKLKKDTRRFMNAYLSDKTNRRVDHFFDTAHECFRNFFIGQFIEAILLGTLTFIGSTILKLPYSAMTGTIVGVTALIPIIGAFLGAGIGAFIIFTVNPTQALVFIIFLVILQQLDNNIFYPKIVGTSVGLPGIWVLAAVTVGGSLCGIMGMIVGVPLAATFYKLYFERLELREKELGIEIEKDIEPSAEKKKEKNKKPKKTSRSK